MKYHPFNNDLRLSCIDSHSERKELNLLLYRVLVFFLAATCHAALQPTMSAGELKVGEPHPGFGAASVPSNQIFLQQALKEFFTSTSFQTNCHLLAWTLIVGKSLDP